MTTKKICKSCGAISFNKEDICPVCNIPLITVPFFTGRKIDNLGGEDRDKYIEEITGQKLNPIMVQKRKDYLKKIYKEQKEILQKREGRIVSRSNTIIKSFRQCRSMLLWIFDSQISSHNTDLQTS